MEELYAEGLALIIHRSGVLPLPILRNAAMGGILA